MFITSIILANCFRLNCCFSNNLIELHFDGLNFGIARALLKIET